MMVALSGLLVAACAAPERPQESAHVERSVSREDTMKDRYQWGEPACGGIAIGLSVERSRIGISEAIHYQMAFANRSNEQRTIVLFYDLEGTYRTRLITKHQSGKAIPTGAVKPAVPTTSGVKIEVALAPGEIHERPGAPLTLDASYAGRNTCLLYTSDAADERSSVDLG